MRGMGRIAVLLLITALAAPAAAQERAAAEALFQEGRRLARAGKHAEACEKFAASDKLDPSVGARLQLGRCNRAQGKTASAWLAYKDAENLAARNGDSRRAAAARAEAAQVEPKLSYVVLRAGETPGLLVRFDGDVKPAALLGQRFPVDPGDHTVTAAAPERSEWTMTVAVDKPGVVRVDIPVLERIEPKKTVTPEPEPKPEPEKVQPQPEPEPVPVPEPTPEDSSRDGSGRRLLAYGVAGGGLALVATGIVFGQLARSAYNDRVDFCMAGNLCTPEGIDLIDKAKSRATVATALTIAGGAAVAAGVVLYLTAPSGDGGGSVALAPAAGPGYAGLALTGAL